MIKLVLGTRKSSVNCNFMNDRLFSGTYPVTHDARKSYGRANRGTLLEDTGEMLRGSGTGYHQIVLTKLYLSLPKHNTRVKPAHHINIYSDRK